LADLLLLQFIHEDGFLDGARALHLAALDRLGEGSSLLLPCLALSDNVENILSLIECHPWLFRSSPEYGIGCFLSSGTVVGAVCVGWEFTDLVLGLLLGVRRHLLDVAGVREVHNPVHVLHLWLVDLISCV